MKKITSFLFLLFLPIWIHGQTSIEEFRKLEKIVINLVSENQQLKEKISSLETKLNNVNRTSQGRNSLTKRSLEKQVVQIDNKIDSLAKQSEIKLDNILPIGSIVPYHLNPRNLPDNWVMCHGQKITDLESIYFGRRVPDLKKYFIRGKSDFEKNGQVAGQDYISGHFHEIPPHNHEIGRHSHKFITDYSKMVGKFTNCVDSNKGLKCMQENGDARFFLTDSSLSGIKNKTSHRHSGRTDKSSKGYTGLTDKDTKASQGHSNIPKYRAFNYIIKIK